MVGYQMGVVGMLVTEKESKLAGRRRVVVVVVRVAGEARVQAY